MLAIGGCSSATTLAAHVMEVETGSSTIFDVEQIPLRRRPIKPATSTTIGFVSGAVELTKEALTIQALASTDAHTCFARIRPDDEDAIGDQPEIDYSSL